MVTSGAIALGRAALELKARVLRLEDKQAAAAVGQINLAHAYQASLARHGLPTAQLLLTLGDTESRRRYLNARATIEALLKLGVVPVVNENDTVATNEIRFGDNDRLSGARRRDGERRSADPLVGRGRAVHRRSGPPSRRGAAGGGRRDHPGDRGDGGGRGLLGRHRRHGEQAGCRAHRDPRRLLGDHCAGQRPRPLARLAEGGPCTRFPARANPRRARKEWIAGALAAMGVLRIDGGAARALRRGSSLLPAGVVAVEGAFGRGDAVIVRDPDGNDIAKGLSAYDADDARRICGQRTEQIAALLGYRGRDELIHRDDLVLL